MSISLPCTTYDRQPRNGRATLIHPFPPRVSLECHHFAFSSKCVLSFEHHQITPKDASAMMANPKTIGLCIFLFLASALVTLTIKQTHHRTPFLTTHRKGINTSISTTQQQVLQTHKVAFATFLAANSNPDKKPTDEESAAIDDADDGYFVSTRVLAYTLLHSKSAGTNNSIPFIVLCTRDVSKRKRDRLKKDGATVILVEKLRADWMNAAVERWADILAKLRLFQLMEYSKICFIDADTLVTGPLDGVFFDEATLTQATLANPEHIKDDEAPLPRTYMFAAHADYWGYDHPFPPPTDLNYLNCGFLVLTPSLVLFNYYMSLIGLPGRFDPRYV